MTTFALRAAQLYPGTGDALVNDPVVLIEDGRISRITTGPHVPETVELIDLAGTVLVPGLIDTHVHLCFDASMDSVAPARSLNDDELLELMRTNARRALEAGITSVRDLGDRGFLSLGLRDELQTDPTAGPHVAASGPPLTVRDGHLHYLGGTVEDAKHIRSAVRRWSERGVDVVKLVLSGGELTPGTDPLVSSMTPDMLRVAVEEAHEHGLRVCAHAHATPAVRMAIDAGVDSVEHGVFMATEPADVLDEICGRLTESATTLCPTVGAVPGGPPPPPRIAERIDQFYSLLGRMHRAGVQLTAGSDAGIAPPKPFNVLPYTIAEMAQAGLGAAAALRSATSVAADACGLAGKGRLQSGMDADIVAIGSDPLRDPLALLDVRAVFRAGGRVR